MRLNKPTSLGHRSRVAALASLVLLAPALASANVPDVVLHWNAVTMDVIRADRTLPGPGWSSRNAAIVHVAMFDTLESYRRHYRTLLVGTLSAPKKAHVEAAVSAAAYATLVRLYPGQKAKLAAELASVVKGFAGADPHEISKNMDFGDFIGRKVLSLRAHDGSSTVVPYTAGTNPGEWRPTPPDFGPAWGPGWGNVKPFAIQDADAFLPPQPPALTSAEYAAAYEEVRTLGAKNSAVRTAEQTEIGLFWAYDRAEMGTPIILYNDIARTIAHQKNNSMDQNARLFALVHVAMADAGVVAWREKFLSNLWRPHTAIPEGDNDGNPLTVSDPSWEPLGAPGVNGGYFTPPFPAYISGHGTFGSASMNVIANFYGTDQIAFSLKSDEVPGVTRSYSSLSQAIQENGDSRVYLGVHWRFDCAAALTVGKSIADDIFARATKRK
jgi:hypothetical protein